MTMGDEADADWQAGLGEWGYDHAMGADAADGPPPHISKRQRKNRRYRANKRSRTAGDLDRACPNDPKG